MRILTVTFIWLYVQGLQDNEHMERAASSLDASQKIPQDPCQQHGGTRQKVQRAVMLGKQHIMQVGIQQY